MRIKLTNHRILTWLTFYTAFVAFVALTKEFFGITSVLIIFPYLIFVPGFLILLAVRMNAASRWLFLFYAVCLSLLVLMLIALSANWVLPLFGIKQALSTLPLLTVFSTFMVGLLIWASRSGSKIQQSFDFSISRIDWSYATPLIFILLSVMGATRLNNGASNIFTIILLAAVAGDFYYLFKHCRTLPQAKILFHVFCIGLSLLLMTSLRGWFVTGHDVQREYFVFQLTKENWHWQVSSFRDPYNACLSITLLPTLLTSFMKISDPYIYKVLFQILFAFCPVAVYLLVQRISNRKLATLSVIYFMAFPTFFSDMPMLNRQEIAFLLFAGLLLLLTDTKSRYKLRVILFSLFGIGIILSHYSTTYALLVMFTTAYCVRYILETKTMLRIINWLFRRFNRDTPKFIGKRSKGKLVLAPMIFGLAVVALFWNVQITKTSGGLLDTAGNALKSITGNIKDDSRSADTGASLFGGAKPDPNVTVSKYIKEQEAIRTSLDQENYYSANDYKISDMKASEESPQPLTPFGNLATKIGINVFDFTFLVRQSFAKILQLLVLIGIGLMFFSKRLKLHPSAEYISMSIASVFFLTILLFVPVLSVDYGLLRAFQQVLVVLALPTAVGSLAVASFFSRRHAIGLTITLALAFFLTSTGFLAELSGGYFAPLHLKNAGAYFDSYYPQQGENAAEKWLSMQKEKADLHSDIGADRIASGNLKIRETYNLVDDIYPGIISREAYVLLDESTAQKGVAFALYQNEALQYRFPVNFLDAQKDLIYSNQQARIYR